MNQKQVLSLLLEADTEYRQNIILLKKLMLTVYLGRLRINDQPPDQRFSLRDYFFDDERTVLDFTRLSDAHRFKFNQWLLDPHKNQKTAVVSNIETNEYRGFTAEVALSYWGQFINWLFNTFQYQWKLADFSMSLDYQLMGLEICEGKKGLLLGFKQLLAPAMTNKYYDASEIHQEVIGNTKRVYLTNAVVDILVKTPLEKVDFTEIYDKSHPQSIEVRDYNNRFKAMQEYRQIQQFTFKPWYIEVVDWCISLFNWCKSWFVDEKKTQTLPVINDNTLEPLFQADGVSFYTRRNSEEIVVVEPRPEVDTMVYCGGGAKMFAHVGVMQALEEEGIYPLHFSGSSAGAFIALMAYLGYKAHEVLDFLQQFKQENLLHYDYDYTGLSSTNGLKAAVDFMIAQKVAAITKKYGIPHPQGLITFTTLDKLRQLCPDCGIGKELAVTATNKRESQTRYFSLFHTPNKEVSEVVTASASIPLVYKPTLIEGEEHTDGGILNNFPTDAFRDDNSTFLEEENGNNLKLLAVQFDNGTERSTVDKVMERVYKENVFLNAFYRLVTGVKDPASGWEQDRIKLRQHALQSVIVKVDNVAATAFNLSPQEKLKLVENGLKATKKYIKTRYCRNEVAASTDELMYSTFASIGDLLSYCCYRNQKRWFDRIHKWIHSAKLANKQTLLEQASLLHSLYFNKEALAPPYAPEFFGRRFSTTLAKTLLTQEHYDYFRTLYPLCLAMSKAYLQAKNAKADFEKYRHNFNLQSSLYHFGNELARISGKTHLLFYITVVILQAVNAKTCTELYPAIKDLTAIYKRGQNLMQPQFFGNWQLPFEECMRFLHLFKNNQLAVARSRCVAKALQVKPFEKEKPLKEPQIPFSLMGRAM